MKLFGLLFAAILLLPAAGREQTIDDLRAELNQTEEEIRITNELLSKTKSERQVSQNQLKLIQNTITNRRNIVSNLDKQSTVITGDITAKSLTIQQLEDSVGTLRREYADMVYNVYKNYKLNNFLVFLFSSKDFNDVTRRISYMRRYNQMRVRKAAEIDSMSVLISGEIIQLEGKKDDLVKVRQGRENEIKSLAKDQTEYQTAATRLSRQESQLAAKVKEQERQRAQIQQKIKDLVAAEARKNNAATLSAAEQEYIAGLSGRFDQNMGKLPYPLRGGVIVDRYGIHPHPTMKGITVNNTGINIAGEKGADVKSVFEGDVSQVVIMQGANNTVLIRHGNYITVYSNLTQVNVKSGDKVAINQTIGKMANTDDSDDYVLHFEIWKIAQGSATPANLNPTPWLMR